MSIIRIKHTSENPYVILNKQSLWDENLSLQSVGLWARCLSRPDDWTFTTKELAKSCGINVDTIKKYIKELIDNGYAIRIHKKDEKGKFCGIEYIFFERKLSPEELCRFSNNFSAEEKAGDGFSSAGTLPPTNIEYTKHTSNDVFKEPDLTSPKPSPKKMPKKEVKSSQVSKYKEKLLKIPFKEKKDGETKIVHFSEEEVDQILSDYSEEHIQKAALNISKRIQNERLKNKPILSEKGYFLDSLKNFKKGKYR